jgi:hypothetical protein
MLTNYVEKKLYENIQNGILDDSVLELLLPSGRPHDFESWVFDYKLQYHKSKEKKALDFEVAEIMKDFIAFYNSMGGYILFTCPALEEEPPIFTALRNSDDIKRRLAAYSGVTISVQNYSGNCNVASTNNSFICYLIPKRPPRNKPVAFIKNSPNVGSADKPSHIFKKNDILVRNDFECVPANNNLELLTFLFSDRDPNVFLSFYSTENNLPPKDPNLIRFVGRRTYLEDLWAWLADFRSPIRVLTALGGIGKTAVAYEFATQVIDRPGNSLDKVVWLSGKKMTFSAIRGKLEPTTRCDFSDVDTFLDALLLNVGFSAKDIRALSDREERISSALEAFSTFDILLIVDDVDSLDKDEQNNLYSIVSDIIIRAAQSRNKSRALFTSRLELLTCAHQRVTMEGFIGDEFDQFLGMVTSYFISDETIREKIESSKQKILDASGGSAIFIASIVRLVSLGYGLSESLNLWKGNKGEKVREFAFQKEIATLTEAQGLSEERLSRMSRL